MKGSTDSQSKKPHVSTPTDSPTAAQRERNSRTNAGCASGSPPESVTPPPEFR